MTSQGSRWPLIAAAAAGAVITLLIVTIGGGDDDDATQTKDANDVVAVQDAGGAGQDPLPPPPNGPDPAKGPPADAYPVAFASTPPGAQVWIRMDKRIRLLCNTPCTFKLPTGKEVLVELKLDGYKSAQGTIVVAEGARFEASFRKR